MTDSYGDSKSHSRIHFTKEDDRDLLNLVTNENPFVCGKQWRAIAETLKERRMKKFTSKNVRDRVSRLITLFRARDKTLMPSSGKEEGYYGEQDRILQKVSDMKQLVEDNPRLKQQHSKNSEKVVSEEAVEGFVDPTEYYEENSRQLNERQKMIISSNGGPKRSSSVEKERKDHVSITIADDIVLLQEVISLNPYEAPERWQTVAENVRALIPKQFTPRDIRVRVIMILEQLAGKTINPLMMKSVTSEQYALRNQLLQDVKSLIDLERRKNSSFITEKSDEMGDEAADPLEISSNSGASSPLDVRPGMAEFIIEDQMSNISAMNEVLLMPTTIPSSEEVAVALGEIPSTPQDILRHNSLPSKPETAVRHVSNLTRPRNSTVSPTDTQLRRRTRSSSSDSSCSSYAGGPMRVKNKVQVNQYLKEKNEIELIKARAKLLKQENEKRRIELEEKKLETLQSTQNRLISIVEQLVKQRSRPDVKDQSLSNLTSTFVLHPKS